MDQLILKQYSHIGYKQDNDQTVIVIIIPTNALLFPRFFLYFKTQDVWNRLK